MANLTDSVLSRLNGGIPDMPTGDGLIVDPTCPSQKPDWRKGVTDAKVGLTGRTAALASCLSDMTASLLQPC